MKLKYFIFSFVIICYSFTLSAQKYEWKPEVIVTLS
jgi:hypothetical protein